MNIVHSHNPFNPTERQFYFAPDEFTIEEFLAHNNITFHRPTVCIANGSDGVMRKDWRTSEVGQFETLAFVTLPEGGDGGSNPVAVIAMMAVVAFAAPAAGAWASIVSGNAAVGLAVKAAVMIGGMALVNALVPPPKPPSTHYQNAQSASPIYSLQAQGNSARLGSSIPKIYGTHPVYPDFAAQPYTEYNGNEQYLYQLFCIGLGEYDISNIRIEDTPIGSFSEVDYEIINPGESVTLFPSNVETSVEVSGQELLQGQYVGGFIANASGTLTNSIGIDIVLPKGLFSANDDGGLDPVSVAFQIEYAPVDDQGVLTGAYAVLGVDSISAATYTPQRRSYRYTVPSGRYSVRATRTNAKNTSSRVGNDIQWTGLKAYIPGTQDYGNVTLLAVRMRATNNLSQTSSRKVNLTAAGKVYTWDSVDGWSAQPVATSKPAWILADICRAEYGGQLDDSRYSLLGLEALQNTLDNRNIPFDEPDEFNGVFDNRMTFWEALQLVCKSVRAMPIRQGGVIHFIRDQAQTIPTQHFSMRNIVKGSFKLTYILPSEETADAVEVEYFNRDTMKPATVLCELNPGNSTTVAKVKMFGVVHRDQAYREGMYLASANKNRRILASFDTEMEGNIPVPGDLVTVSHDMPNWGQSGEIVQVEDYTALLYRLHLSEPVVEGTGQHYIILRRKDGTPTNAITCDVDVTDKTLVTVAKADIDFTINDGDDFERTHWSFGVATEMYRRCRVIPPVKPKNGGRFEINLVNESDAVHIADTGIAPALDAVFDLPPPIVKPVIATLNITQGGTPDSPQLGMSWTPAAEADHYIIEWGLNGLEWTRAGEATTNNYILNVSPDVVHVRVAAVGLVQGDWISQTIDARLMPIPGQVQNLALAEAFTGSQAKIKYSGAARAHSYQVEVWNGAVKRRTVTTNRLEFAYTSEDATADGGPWRNLVFDVYGLNDSGISDTVASLAVSNPAPPEMTGITIFAGYKSIMITYDPVADTDFAGVRVCMSTTQGFTPGDPNVVYEGNETVITIIDLPENTTQYLRLAAYDQFGKDVLNYTTTEYTGTPSSTALIPADVLTKMNEALAAPGDSLILEADRFAVQLNGSDTYPLIIANVDGTDYIGIAADVVVQGAISADQITSGALDVGTDISVGDGAMVLDGNGAITVYDGDNTVPNRDFAFLSGGELSFQQYWNGAYHEYKSVKRVEEGSADSGTTVTLAGYWKTQPRIIVSPNELESYVVAYTNQSQKWHVLAQNLREDPASSGIYKFDAVAELILAANAGTDNPNQSTTQSTDTWTSSIYTLPLNTSEIDVSVSVKSKRGAGTDGVTYYYRKVSWRVHYHDTVLDTWSQSAWRDITIGANLDNTVADSATVTLPANITEYYVEFVAADAGGTFSSGTQTYLYTNANVGSVSQNYAVSRGANQTVTLPAYSPPPGYSIYQVAYQWIWGNNNIVAGYLQGNTGETGISFSDPNGSRSLTVAPSPYILCSAYNNLGQAVIIHKLNNHGPYYKTVTTTSYDRNYIYANNIIDHLGSVALLDSCSNYNAIQISVYNATATVYSRKPVNNSSTPDNTFNLLSTTWTLSGTSALATGSMNYMAVEG